MHASAALERFGGRAGSGVSYDRRLCDSRRPRTDSVSASSRHVLSFDLSYVPEPMEFFSDVGSDPLKPSLFELVAQEQLRDLLQPALKYVLSVCPDMRSVSPCASELTWTMIGVCAKVPSLPAANSEQA